MNYQTVFDVTTVGFKSLPFALGGLPFLAVGLILLFLNEKFDLSNIFWSNWTRSRLRGFAILYSGFALVWTLMVFPGVYSDYSRLKNAMQNNQCEVVEGVVTQFKPEPATGHAMETFTVNGHSFSYSNYVITAGFNNSRSHGGPIREGLRVRIHCLGDEIAKLEIAN